MAMVEIDTATRLTETISLLEQNTPGSTPIILHFDSRTNSAAELLQRTQKTIVDKQQEIPVVYLSDRAKEENRQGINFYREMNALREAWAELGAHLIFFLYPATYRLLIREADHLADWIPLKLHIIGDNEQSQPGVAREQTNMTLSLGNNLEPGAASRQLKILEKQLRKALADNADSQTKTNRYYLPMFIAAVCANELGRAQNLRKKIVETDIAKRDFESWWQHNFQLDYGLRRLEEAALWLDKLYDLFSGRGEEAAIASVVFHNRGMIAQEKRDFSSAEQWYKKSLAIEEKHGNEYGAAISYGQLGNLFLEQRKFKAAEVWYKKALAIFEKQENEHGAASSYHQLGIIAEEQRDFSSAEQWYKKSLAINEKQGNEYGAAITYNQLGQLARLQQDYPVAAKWYLKAMSIFLRFGDAHNFDIVARNYSLAVQAAEPETQTILRQNWRDAGLDEVVSLDTEARRHGGKGGRCLIVEYEP